MKKTDVKKLLIINEVCGHTSTGRICTDIAEQYDSDGWEVKVAYGRDKYVPKKYTKYAIRIGTMPEVYFHALESRLFDDSGFGSRWATKRFLNWADEYDPDMIWLHNLHGYYINVKYLFEWIKKKPHLEVRWTLHDCWAFTGHCTYFSYAKCDKWELQCSKCIQKNTYPKAILRDNSYENYRKKQKIFTGVENLMLITPSNWLASLARRSFLKDYTIQVHYNSVNTSIFKPCESDFRVKFGIQNKKILLGVSNSWNEPRKGLSDFVKLENICDENYVIVLVGIDGADVNIPHSIIKIKKISDAAELAKIYSAADVFLNLTYEDNYPTVNLEAAACGTPVITYRTGGSPESVPKENVCEQGDIESVYRRVKQLCGR